MSISITTWNGHPATADDLVPLAFAGFAHFTAMQVRRGAVRGLDLHLARLRTASDTLYGRHLGDDYLRGLLAGALAAAPPEVSLSCYVSTRPGEFASAGAGAELDVLVKLTDPVTAPVGPLTLELVTHERHLPHIKHVGEIAKTQLLRQANTLGYDDAAFCDTTGRISESTIWNLAFWDGHTVIWPEAESLPGVTQQVLQRQLSAAGRPQLNHPVRAEELSSGLAAAVMNSWSPGIGVARFGENRLADAGPFVDLLQAAYADEPLTTI